jgi:hypothetical protein
MSNLRAELRDLYRSLAVDKVISTRRLHGVWMRQETPMVYVKALALE